MKKVDYFIFGGLTVSLVLFLYLTSLSTSSQNAIVIENQRLIKKALLITQNNSERIIENQKGIAQALNQSTQNAQEIRESQAALQRMSNQIDTNTDSNRNMTIENRAMITALNNTFTKGFAENVTLRQVETLTTSNETLFNTDEILNMLKKPAPIRSGPS